MNVYTHILYIAIVTYIALLSDSSLEGMSMILSLLYRESSAEPEEHFMHALEVSSEQEGLPIQRQRIPTLLSSGGTLLTEPDLFEVVLREFTFKVKSDI